MKKWIWIALILIGITACDGDNTAVSSPTVRDIQVALVNLEITPGQTRFAVGLLDSDQQLIHDAEVSFEYFDLSDPDNPVTEQTVTAVRRQTTDGFTTIFTHLRSFERAGTWGLQVNATFPDNSVAQQRIAFEVITEAKSLPVGFAAPVVDTPTGSSVNGDLAKISSAFDPVPEFYEMSLQDALDNGRSTILYFSTPAFCQTRLCGPGYEELATYYEEAANEYNFIHVEAFSGLPDPSETGWPLASAMVAFGLATEPWLYIIDESGTVVYRIEGLFTAAELSETLPQVLNDR